MKTRFNELYTEAGEKLKNDPSIIPWDVYPRPRMRRREWLNLNGEWELADENGRTHERIRVPFPIESALASVDGGVSRPCIGVKYIYKRRFLLPESWLGGRVLLHYTASRRSEVFVNGADFPGGESAYSEVCRDITEALRSGENELAITCVNDLDPAYPYGKQKLKRGGMWYTPCTGLWRTVWLEPVPEEHIASIECVRDGDAQIVRVSGAVDGEIVCGGRTYPLKNGVCRIRPDFVRLWSPEEPNLYPFTVKSGGDEVESYFAFRTVEISAVGGVPRILLNGKPYFFNGLLDQGYYSDGLWTPAEPEEYERDILKMKALGFNMLRKHIKIEPELFYYYCDKLGMAVFQDMVNNGRYGFLRDTLLPTVGITKLNDGHLHPDPRSRSEFLTHMTAVREQVGGHPSVVYWTVFNEGWGQFRADEAYELLHGADSSRPIDTTSGWFQRNKTDVDSRHIYFKKLRLGKRREKPQVISEFGGYVWKDAAHSFNPDRTYGYKLFRTRRDFVSAFRRLYLDELVPLAERGLCAAVYTQLSDVEDETNGILTFDRRSAKLLPEETADIAQALKNAAQHEKR